MKLIAETAWHHDGDYKFFKNLVQQICNKTKADYIKFHLTLKNQTNILHKLHHLILVQIILLLNLY